MSNDEDPGTHYESTDAPPDDPVLAQYEAPHLEGFEEQEEKLRIYRESIAQNQEEPVLIDPSRGIGIPRYGGDTSPR